jgi:hypothetical protein
MRKLAIWMIKPMRPTADYQETWWEQEIVPALKPAEAVEPGPVRLARKKSNSGETLHAGSAQQTRT